MKLKTDREKVAHLLRRFGLGASEAEVNFYSQGGLKGAIDSLLNYEQTDEGFDLPITKFQNGKNKINMFAVQGWWVARLMATRRPLQEKMTLFWHNHFATSGEKVVQPLLMYQQNDVLRQFATSRFQDLLMNVSKDPAMLFWLDNEYNVKGKANENFAREVMELFTLGIGHYTEKDIQESARAFTGWSIRRVPADPSMGAQARTAVFFLRDAMHDTGTKRFLGSTGNFDGEDIIGMLCGNPRTARFITHKLWEWFVYPKPDESTVEHFAADFYSHGLDIKRLLRSIMESDEFYSDRAFRAIYKNPVDFVIPPLRQLGVGAQVVALAKDQESVAGLPRATIGAAQQALKLMGMTLLFPPDVSGWEGGPAWITSATMVQRIQYGESIFGAAAPGSGRAQIAYDATPLFSGDPTPKGVVDKLLSVFDAPVAESKKPILVKAAGDAAQGPITDANASKVAGHVTRLIFGTPEYQVS